MTDENAAAGAVLGAVAGVGGAVGAAIGSLFAAEGTLGRLLEGASNQKFEVNHENILQSGKIINIQIEALRNAYDNAITDLNIPPLADEVNQAIAKAWNSRLGDGEDSYAGRVRQYIDCLVNLSDQLKTAAIQYGFTEDEVKTAMGAV